MFYSQVLGFERFRQEEVFNEIDTDAGVHRHIFVRDVR